LIWLGSKVDGPDIVYLDTIAEGSIQHHHGGDNALSIVNSDKNFLERNSIAKEETVIESDAAVGISSSLVYVTLLGGVVI